MTTVTVYFNIGTPKVYLNGKEPGGVRKGYTNVHYIFDNVVLADGKNVLEAVATIRGKEYTNGITRNCFGEKNREVDSYESKNEHSGL